MFRKNVAGQFIHFQGVDASTGGIKSGVTWTVRRCIDGTFAAGGGTVTEDGTTGWYKYAMSQADTNGNNIGFNFTGTGAVPQTVNIVTTAADPTDAVRLGLTALPNAAAEAAGGLYTRGTGAGQINQNANGQVDTRWVAGNVTVGTNNDKTGYALSAAGVQAIWDALTSALTTVGSIGKLLVDNINATISSRSSHTAADVWASGTRTLTSFGTLAQDVWDKLTTALTTVGSVGKLVVDNLNAAITTRAVAGDAMTLTAAYDAAKTASQAGDAMALTAGAVDAIADEVYEGTLTHRQITRIILAAVAGKSSGFPSGPASYRDNADVKDRITATVDPDGNRSIVVLDGT
ncbi:MAG TPA: hypothetical protein VJS69_00490 [Candidatus Krumholzibacteria bacterium]|nr:hypothetical protein [Candidatus Krumholzibacteria bacterium]